MKMNKEELEYVVKSYNKRGKLSTVSMHMFANMQKGLVSASVELLVMARQAKNISLTIREENQNEMLDESYNENEIIEEFLSWSQNISYQNVPVVPNVRVVKTCGRYGRVGPTKENCEQFYANTELSGEISHESPGFQLWTVPETGC